jgi:hypothetical protein
MWKVEKDYSVVNCRCGYHRAKIGKMSNNWQIVIKLMSLSP